MICAKRVQFLFLYELLTSIPDWYSVTERPEHETWEGPEDIEETFGFLGTGPTNLTLRSR
jgi:hypothetical protein